MSDHLTFWLESEDLAKLKSVMHRLYNDRPENRGGDALRDMANLMHSVLTRIEQYQVLPTMDKT